jgi:hypothetical protein
LACHLHDLPFLANGKWHSFLDVIETKNSHLSDILLKRTRWQMVCHSWQMANGKWHLLK